MTKPKKIPKFKIKEGDPVKLYEWRNKEEDRLLDVTASTDSEYDPESESWVIGISYEQPEKDHHWAWYDFELNVWYSGDL